MRLSTEQVFRSGVESMLGTQSRLLETQQQISSGKRIDSAADDPVAMSKIIKLKHQLAVNEQHQANTDATRRRLSLEEVALGQINTTTDRLRELTIQAGDGALTKQDRVSLTFEMEQRLNELAGLMNSRDSEGEYLFAGNQGHTKPFTIDPATGNYVYNGDDGQRFIPVNSELNIASGDPGSRVFESASRAIGVSLTGAAAGNLANGVVTDHEAYQTFQDNLGPATITFIDSGSGTDGTYSVVDSNGDPVSGGDPLQPLTAIPYQVGDAIDFEGVRLEINASVSGDAVVAGDEGVQNLLVSTQQLINGLLSSDTSTELGRARLKETIDSGLINLDGAQDKVTDTRAQLGGRLNTLDSVEDLNLDRQLFNQEALSGLEDLDLTEAITKFTLLEASLSAAQASFARIQGLSLFNFLR